MPSFDLGSTAFRGLHPALVVAVHEIDLMVSVPLAPLTGSLLALALDVQIVMVRPHLDFDVVLVGVFDEVRQPRIVPSDVDETV